MSSGACGPIRHLPEDRITAYNPTMPEETAPRLQVTFTARILRKRDDLPRYVVVKPQYVTGRSGAFTAEVTLNGSSPFLRNIRPWGKGSDVYFFNLTAPQCAKASLEANDRCTVTITENT